MLLLVLFLSVVELREGGGTINPLIATLKLQSLGPSYSNTVIGTLAVDGWAVTCPSSLYQMLQPAIVPTSYYLM